MVLKNQDESQCGMSCRVTTSPHEDAVASCLNQGPQRPVLSAVHGADRQRTQTSVPGRSSQWSTRGKNLQL